MRVLIVAKTVLGNRFCVGALDSEGNSLRLFEEGWEYPRADSPYKVGQEWDMEVEQKVSPRPPHVEDVLVTRRKPRGVVADMVDRLHGMVQPWDGPITGLYEGKLNFTGRKRGYIAEPDVPSRSTWFWTPDKPLTKVEINHKVYYRYDDYEMSYVGVEPAVDIIPAGALVRISLASWWKQPQAGDELPERCYLQLSGWYL